MEVCYTAIENQNTKLESNCASHLMNEGRELMVSLMSVWGHFLRSVPTCRYNSFNIHLCFWELLWQSVFITHMVCIRHSHSLQRAHESDEGSSQVHRAVMWKAVHWKEGRPLHPFIGKNVCFLLGLWWYVILWNSARTSRMTSWVSGWKQLLS